MMQNNRKTVPNLPELYWGRGGIQASNALISGTEFYTGFHVCQVMWKSNKAFVRPNKASVLVPLGVIVSERNPSLFRAEECFQGFFSRLLARIKQKLSTTGDITAALPAFHYPDC